MREAIRAMPFLSCSDFSRREAEAVAAAWENAFIEDDQKTHFRVAVRRSTAIWSRKVFRQKRRQTKKNVARRNEKSRENPASSTP
ncbi:DUF905 family protein [Klebsiella michiganensis]|uniref:DUF905 domain-containing protein n=1 Tax=Klebsiella michiganensis TaxID=1134687 RepID=A0A6P1V822_9ENTR|nr:DUF905 family protein [Klebsiella michiganensis]QHS50037.1 DUF905 domain-containing protein [Klebsiella michiganensis]